MSRKPEPLDLYTVERWHEDAEAAARARAGLRLCEARNRPLGAWWLLPAVILGGVLIGMSAAAVVLWWLA